MESFWNKALDQFGLEDPFGAEKTTPAMRETLRRATPLMDSGAPDLPEIRDLSVPGPAGERPARLYVPNGADAPAPGLLFLHGGGFMIGDLDTHDPLCRRLAATAGVRVLALDYRLAPEHAFPAALQDSLACLDWMTGAGAQEIGMDPQRIAVGGDSAGGTLSARLAQKRRDRLAFQMLIQPLMQLAETRKPRLKALEGHLFSVETLNSIRKAYVAGADPSDPDISPLFESDLKGLPPVFLSLAELDPLKDEGEAYRDRLIASGVKVQTQIGKALPHGFYSACTLMPGAASLVTEAALALSAALKPEG